MVRRIVVVRPQESLATGWRTRSFAPAARAVKPLQKVRGVNFLERFHPAQVRGRLAVPRAQPRAAGFNYAQAGPAKSYALVAEFESHEAAERLQVDHPEEVVGVFADLKIAPVKRPYCGERAVGNVAGVERQIGVSALRRLGLTGRGVRVAILDTGIDGRRVQVAGGWGPSKTYKPGKSPADHGTMVAFDLGIAAPEAEIYDYALLSSNEASWTGFLSDGIAAYADLLTLIESQPGPLVVNNSWALYDRAEDDPIGSPGNYSANPQHPFNQMVASLVAAGADVFFAAGNCGGDCPDERCGAKDHGPGASIHGANSHPDVITVAAVTVDGRRLGSSSQGPGGMASRKPDLAASSHFRGSGVFPADSGTSAASPVAAGVAAALRQRLNNPEKFKPGQLKGLLQRTADDLERDGWDHDLGYGVIDAEAAVKRMGWKTAKKQTTRKQTTKKQTAKKQTAKKQTARKSARRK